MSCPRILLMAGGTGGHIFPALAVAQWLSARGWYTAWLGSEGGMEEQIVPAYDIELKTIPVAGVRGKSLLTRMMSPFMLLRTVWQAMKVVRSVRPDVVLGMGGFASGPGGLASKILGYPLCIHEQNAIAGMTNRYLSRLTKFRLEAFAGSLPAPAEEVGNPVRDEISAISEPEGRYQKRQGPLRILIVGGSRGAAILNEVVPQSVAQVAQQMECLVRHQAGAGNRGVVVERYSEAMSNTEHSLTEAVQVDDFIDDMQAAYEWADLVICRSGALTISELAVAGIASILVPFPHAVDDHQTVNANYLVSVGGAVLLPQTDLTPDHLTRLIISLRERAACKAMALKARTRARTNATEVVARRCAEAAGIAVGEPV